MSNKYILTSDGNFVNATESLPKKNTICYIDLYENELMHWKYIKREKLPNGKYRYYYDESELEKYKNYAKEAQAKSLRAAARVVNIESDYDKAIDETGSAWIKNVTAKKVSDKNETYKQWSNALHNEQDIRDKLDSAKRAYGKAYDRADQAYKTYQTKKITSFAERTISKGVVAVMNWLSGFWRR